MCVWYTMYFLGTLNYIYRDNRPNTGSIIIVLLKFCFLLLLLIINLDPFSQKLKSYVRWLAYRSICKFGTNFFVIFKHNNCMIWKMVLLILSLKMQNLSCFLQKSSFISLGSQIQKAITYWGEKYGTLKRK